MPWMESFAVAITLISVYLTVRQNIWSWPTAIVGVSLYAILFWETKLYADMGLQFFYITISFYGWYEWLYGGENRTTLHVSRVPPRLYALLLGIGAPAAGIIGLVLRTYTDAALPFLDSTLVAYSLVAQFMMTRKYLENWVIWIAVDVIYVGMFIFKKLYLTSGLYAVFIFLAAMGYLEWKRSMEPAAEAEVLSPES